MPTLRDIAIGAMLAASDLIEDGLDERDADLFGGGHAPLRAGFEMYREVGA